MKKVLKKLLVIILILLVLNNFFINSIYASNVNNNTNSNNTTNPNPVIEVLEGLLGTVIGLFTWPYRLVATGLAIGFHELMGFLAYGSAGIIDDNGNIAPVPTTGFNYTITPLDILFNKVAIVDINFFNFPDETLNPVIYQIREGIATWYYIMRNISIAILLVVLIYVGIRMALATATPEKEAAYKKMLIDWVCSLALVFLLHYIMLFTLNVNSALIGGLSEVQNGEELTQAVEELRLESFKGTVNALACTVVYCYFVIQTLGLLLSYFSRMLKLAFLVIIAPLITLTYSIDKIGDGKAQALSAWLKEFVYTVLIQPFHCIIYMCFINMAFDILSSGAANKQIIGAIFAILCMRFTKEAEKILGKIFQFGNYTSESSLNAGLAMAAVAAQKAGGAGKAVRGAVNGAKKIRTAGRNARIGMVAGTKALFGQRRDADGNKTTFSQRKSTAKAEMQAKALEKENKKYKGTGKEREIEKRTQQLIKKGLNEKDAKKQAEKDYNNSKNAKIDSRAGEIYAQNKDKGMTYAEAKARARAEAAKDDRVGAIRKKGVISGARGIVRKYQSAANLKGFVQHAIAGGTALFIGASVDGATGNLGTAIGAGVAAMKGVKGYFEGSTSNLRDDTQNRLGSMGIAYESDAAEKMNEIMGKGNSGQYNDDAVKDLLKEIEKALISAGMSADQAQNTKFNIRNKIERDVKANPDEDLSRIVDRSLSSLGTVGRNTGVIDAASAFANFSQEKNIYENVSSATELGASADSFVSEVLHGYYNADVATHQPPPEPVIEEEFVERELTDHERDEIIRELQDKYSSLTYTNQYYHAYENDDSWRQEIEDAQDAIQECIRKLRMNATGGRYTQDLHDNIADIREQTRKAMSTKNRGS